MKEGGGLPGADPGHHGGGTALIAPARGVNGTVFVHTKRENIEKCEVTMV